MLGICQFLKYRIGTKKEVKWSISTYNLQFLLPLVNIVTKMGRNLSGASKQALASDISVLRPSVAMIQPSQKK